MSRNRFALTVIALALLLGAALSPRADLFSSAVVLAGDPPNSGVNSPLSAGWRYAIPSNFIQPVVPYNMQDEIQSGFANPVKPGSVREAIPSNFIQPVVPSSAGTSWRYGIPSNFIQPVIPYDVYEEIAWEFDHLAAPTSVREAIPSAFIQPIAPANLPDY